MGTRSVIKFQEDGETICAIYQQFDGYIEGVGATLHDFLKDFTIVNGLSAGQPERVANGMGCLAAQFIAEHKGGSGGFYMTHPEDSQQYNYCVNYDWEGEGWKMEPGPLQITVTSGYSEDPDPLFQGSVEEFGEFIDTYGDEEEEVA